MKLRLPRRRIWRAAIYFGSLVLVLMALDLVLVQMRRTIRPSMSTTRILEPARQDGSIDFTKALDDHLSSGVTSANNAVVPMLQALGRQAIRGREPGDAIANRLGMAPLQENGDYFVTYSEFCRQQSTEPEDDPFDGWHDSPGSTTQLFWMKAKSLPEASGSQASIAPITRKWVEASEKPLALMVEASKRSRFYLPIIPKEHEPLVDTLLTYFNSFKDSLRALRTRALVRLEAGDFDRFKQDILAAHRLARLQAQGPFLIEQLGAMSSERSVYRAEQAAIASGRLSPQQAMDLMQAIDALGDVPSSIDGINRGERFALLDFLQEMARRGPWQAGTLLNEMTGPGPNVVPMAWWKHAGFRFVPVPYEDAMRVMNRYYDAAIAAAQLPTHAQRQAAYQAWEHEIYQISRRNHVSLILSADWPAMIFLPALQNVRKREDMVRTDRNLTRIAMALLQFKAERGAYPTKLAELSPKYLINIPDDLFTDKPLIYAPTAGGYTLYSVGVNMTDDGGKSQRPGDDIDAGLH